MSNRTILFAAIMAPIIGSITGHYMDKDTFIIFMDVSIGIIIAFFVLLLILFAKNYREAFRIFINPQAYVCQICHEPGHSPFECPNDD